MNHKDHKEITFWSCSFLVPSLTFQSCVCVCVSVDLEVQWWLHFLAPVLWFLLESHLIERLLKRGTSFHKVIIYNGTPFINKSLNLNQHVNVWDTLLSAFDDGLWRNVFNMALWNENLLDTCSMSMDRCVINRTGTNYSAVQCSHPFVSSTDRDKGGRSKRKKNESERKIKSSNVFISNVVGGRVTGHKLKD